jgi:hypothetical protein
MPAWKYQKKRSRIFTNDCTGMINRSYFFVCTFTFRPRTPYIVIIRTIAFLSWILWQECFSWSINYVSGYFEARAMKKWNAIGIFIVLVTGVVFLSGCISSASTNAAPMATPVPQIVHGTVLVTPSPTPVITVPASTAPETPTATPVVSETISVIPTTTPVITVPASTAPETPTATPVVSETVSAIPTTTPAIVRVTTDSPYDEPEDYYQNLKPALSTEGVTGTLVIRVEGCPADGLTVFIARNGTDVSPIDDNNLLDRMVVEDQNPVFLQVKILPDGSSESVRLAPGAYSAYLPDKNDNEIEDQQSFTIGAKFMTYVSLTGSSYLPLDSSGCTGCSCSRSR